MKLKIANILILTTLLILILSGCAQTLVVSGLTPFRGNNRYTKIAFHTGYVYDTRKTIADKVQGELLEKGVGTVFIWDLFPVMEDFSPKEFITKIDEESVDAVLIIFPYDGDTWVGEWKERPMNPDNRIDGFGKFHWIGLEGGIGSIFRFNDSVAELYDAKTGALVWYAFIGSRGGEGASAETLVKSIGGKAIWKLTEDGLI